MNLEEIAQKLEASLQEVINKDQYLIRHDINEPAISHRLAVYLEGKFHNFNVDCEYNGNVDADNRRKYISLLKEKAEYLGLLNKNSTDQEVVYRCVFPDIIIHKRGLNGADNNLLVIEIKKTSNPDNGEWDAEKLSRFTSTEYGNRFNYQYGVFIRFVVANPPSYSVEWYHNGARIL